MPTEKSLQLWFKKECKKRDILSYKFSSPAQRGVPDLILVFKSGAVVFVELKHPDGKGKLSTLQTKAIRDIQRQGATVYVSHTKEHLTQILDAHA